MNCKKKLLRLAVTASAAVGCLAADGAAHAGGAAVAHSAAASTSGSARSPAGTIEIDGKTWRVIPTFQCSVHPTPEAYIAGHAADDETILIAIEYHPAEGVTLVSVGKSDGTLVWLAEGDEVTITVSGQRVSGEGRFTRPLDGESRTVPGKFELRCG